MHDKGKLYVDDWAVGFALGLGMGGEALGPILLAQPRPIVAPIMVINPQLSKMLFRVPQASGENCARRLIDISAQPSSSFMP